MIFMTEKVVSLLRFSFEDAPTAGLISKIRHFYDLYFLLGDEECNDYVAGDLKQNLVELIEHDKKEFDRPPKWRDAPILSSPLIVDFDSTWSKISDVYQSELSVLSYRTIHVKVGNHIVKTTAFHHFCYKGFDFPSFVWIWITVGVDFYNHLIAHYIGRSSIDATYN